MPTACSVTLGLALLPDEQYIEGDAGDQRDRAATGSSPSASSAPCWLSLRRSLFTSTRPRSRCFILLALAAMLYIGGGFMVTFLVNVPMNEELAQVGETVFADPETPGAGSGGV